MNLSSSIQIAPGTAQLNKLGRQVALNEFRLALNNIKEDSVPVAHLKNVFDQCMVPAHRVTNAVDKLTAYAKSFGLKKLKHHDVMIALSGKAMLPQEEAKAYDKVIKYLIEGSEDARSLFDFKPSRNADTSVLLAAVDYLSKAHVDFAKEFTFTWKQVYEVLRDRFDQREPKSFHHAFLSEKFNGVKWEKVPGTVRDKTEWKLVKPGDTKNK